VDGRLAGLLIDDRASLREALQVIAREDAANALVVDAERHLVGTVSERQALNAVLAGYDLDAPAAPLVRPAPVTVRPTTSRAEVLDLMQARSLAEVAVVDGDGHVLGLHRTGRVVGAERDNWVLVMAGGRGTRLGSLTADVPKPMLSCARPTVGWPRSPRSPCRPGR
jgi:Mg/Co/Ni transporter MgtE